MTATPGSSILPRLEGVAGRQRLIELLRAQVTLGNEPGLAEHVADIASLSELAPGEILIRQDDIDNHVFFVLSGSFRVLVNGREIATRHAGEHLGEMAIVDPLSRRSATIIATSHSVVARVDGDAFLEFANKYPSVWRTTSLQLCRRLDARKKFHAEPNAQPQLFIGSSGESLPTANALANVLRAEAANAHVSLTVTVWAQGGVFGASRFPIDDLEAQVKVADFAVLVGAADDHVTSRGEDADAPRDNVVFELGLFMGALSRSRTFLLVPHDFKGKLKIPTDLLGLGLLVLKKDAMDAEDAVRQAALDLLDTVTKQGPK
jgi:CRP/FNR family transcriptional regulator, cyclic AMP receptor protein